MQNILKKKNKAANILKQKIKNYNFKQTNNEGKIIRNKKEKKKQKLPEL